MKKFTLIMTNGARTEQVTIMASDREIAKNIAKGIRQRGHKNDRMIKLIRKGE